MILRRMTSHDLGAIEKIEMESLSSWSRDQIAAELSRADTIVIVAEETESVIGGWCCGRFVGDEAELLKIAVHPERRKRGVAHSLLASLEKSLIQHKVQSLFLEVRAQNVPAIALYTKRGFEKVGSRQKYYKDPMDDALILKKEILLSE